MQDDINEHNPGRAEFWQSFYAEGGRLESKEWETRKTKEVRGNGSLLDHYEWFMAYPQYEEALRHCLLVVLGEEGGTRGRTLRVLHVGCGNSDLCVHLEEAASSTLGAGTQVEVLNVDICGSLMTRLASRYPTRLYATGNCCSLVSRADSEVGPAYSEWEWYRYKRPLRLPDGEGSDAASLELAGVRHSTVDLVCDKGTLDALLSAFAGDFNPNVEAFANEMLSALRPGGLMFIVSINAEDVVCSYFLAANDQQDTTKGFQLRYRTVIELPKAEAESPRIETLGSHYNCYGFAVLTDG